MTEQNKEDSNKLNPSAPEESASVELDAAGKSLSDALRISFIILKVIMIILVVAFLFSGFERVDTDEQALVLRFGKIRGVGEQRLLGPGAHWIFPYPIDKIIKIPVETKVNLAINKFWYFQTNQDMLAEQKRPVRPGQLLDPLRDGYCIVQGEKQIQASSDPDKKDDDIFRAKWDIFYQEGKLNTELKEYQLSTGQEQIPAGSQGNDYNIVHTKWQLTYQIDDPERFFRNIYVDEVKPGDIYFDVIIRNITPLLENLFEDVVVTTMVNYTIDEAISSQDRIPKHVTRLMQEKLDKIESGIKVVSVQLTKSECPQQVKVAYEDSIKASQTSQKTIEEARTYAENTINETAGPVAYTLLKDKKSAADLSKQEQQLLWSQLAGTAQEKIAEARAYRRKVEENAKANAIYLERLLPEYRQRPKLVIQKIYLDAIEQIYNNADEKFAIQTADDTKGTELRVLLNRDPSLKPKTSREQATQEGQ